MRCANLQVPSDSSTCRSSPQMVAIITVLLLPPMLSLSRCVSLLERYGTCTDGGAGAGPPAWCAPPSRPDSACRCCCARLMITCSRKLSDLLM